jgi:phenylpyruvate tautomerase PptA (4-oxalocrotonate tautomerase family)
MPILDVEIVLRPREKIRPTLARELADRAGEILGSAPGGTWVKVHPIPAERYAEGPGDGPRLTPVFVTILRAKLQSPELRQTEIERLTAAFADVCGRPKENVHLIYLPEGAGRVAFGGRQVQG